MTLAALSSVPIFSYLHIYHLFLMLGLVCGISGRTLLHGEVTSFSVAYNLKRNILTVHVSQVKELSLRVSSSLRGLGLTKGDVVGVLLPNCIEFPLVVQVFQNLSLHLTFNSNPGRSSLWPYHHSHESSLHPSRLTKSLCVIRVFCIDYRRQEIQAT